MVIVQLKGRLGNQLFQYAAGHAIAHRNNLQLKLDVSRYKGQSYYRHYRLNHFNISASIASVAEVARITKKDQGGVSKRITDLFQKALPYYRRSILKEQHRHFDPNVFKVSGNVYLVGFWQSERYFEEIGPKIRQEFTVRFPLHSDSQTISRFIQQTDSVSLHVRRGDYLSKPSYVVCPLTYYHSAVETISRSVRKPHFFVFSDDMSWVKKNLRLDYPTTLVMHNGVERDYEDLWLMSQCNHHIIANSTFSWWGAWLCVNPEKIVIAPRKWLTDPQHDISTLIPDSWIRIND